MSSRIVRVGIIGAGNIVSSIHLPVLKCIEGIEVEWIADVMGNAAKAVAAQYRVKHSVDIRSPNEFPDCDVVLLATPLHARKEYLKELAKRKMPVLVEKPFTATLEEHLAIEAQFQATPLAVGHMRRGYQSMNTLRNLVRHAPFGTLRKVTYSEGARVRSGGANSNLDRPNAEGGGVLRDLGCHGADLINFVTGAVAVEKIKSTIRWDDDTDREAVANFILLIPETDDKLTPCPVDFKVTWLRDVDNYIALHFDNVTVSCSLKPDSQVKVSSKDRVSTATWSTTNQGARTVYQAFYLQWKTFLDSYLKGTKCRYDAKTVRLTTEVVQKLYVSGAKVC